MEKNALPINVYRYAPFNGKEKTNISDRYDRLLLLCDDGYVKVDMDNPPENLVIMEIRDLGFCKHASIRPYAKPKGAGWSAGSNIGFTPDSRFGFNYPLQIHDLDEDWDTYFAISNS